MTRRSPTGKRSQVRLVVHATAALAALVAVPVTGIGTESADRSRLMAVHAPASGLAASGGTPRPRFSNSWSDHGWTVGNAWTVDPRPPLVSAATA